MLLTPDEPAVLFDGQIDTSLPSRFTCLGLSRLAKALSHDAGVALQLMSHAWRLVRGVWDID